MSFASLRLARRALPIGAAVASLGLCSTAFMQPRNDTVAFSPKEWRAFPITGIQQINHNTKVFRVKLPSPRHETGMHVASCIMVQGKDREGKTVARPYTPTTTTQTKGYFDLVIKNYPQGNVSSYMHNLEVGDSINVKGPFAKLPYTANMKKEIGMIAGGSGITPMLQVLHEILDNPNDTTKVTLIYANQGEDDIILRDRLDKWAEEHRNFKVYYVVERAPPGWDQGIGYVNMDMIEKQMPLPGDDSMVLVCGPPPMMEAISGDKAKDKTQGELKGLLKRRGYTSDMVYKF